MSLLRFVLQQSLEVAGAIVFSVPVVAGALATLLLNRVRRSGTIGR